MPQTALFIENDIAWVPVIRKLRGECTLEEWNTPAHRDAAVARVWRDGIANIRSEDEFFITHHPVVLYLRRSDQQLLAADIRQKRSDPPCFIDAKGLPLFHTYLPPSDVVRVKTTYAHWAEGPLPHYEGEVSAAPTPDTDRELQYLLNQNSAIREAVEKAMGPGDYADQSLVFDSSKGMVDFRVRGFFKRREYRQLQSKQVEDSLGKLITHDGIVDMDDGLEEKDLVKATPAPAPTRLAEY